MVLMFQKVRRGSLIWRREEKVVKELPPILKSVTRRDDIGDKEDRSKRNRAPTARTRAEVR
jgi:hypothetical protein